MSEEERKPEEANEAFDWYNDNESAVRINKSVLDEVLKKYKKIKKYQKSNLFQIKKLDE